MAMDRMEELASEPLLVYQPDGRETINDARFFERVAWVRARDYPLAVAAGRAETTFFLPTQDRDAGNVEVVALKAFATAPFLCELRESTKRGGFALQNAPVHGSFIFGRRGGGVGGQPVRSIVCPSGVGLEVKITNRAASLSGNFYLEAEGRALTTRMPKKVRDAIWGAIERRATRPFWLTNDNTVVTLTASQQNVDIYMTVPPWCRIVGANLLARSQGHFSIEVYEHEGGQKLTAGGAIDSRLLCGDGGAPAAIHGLQVAEAEQRVHLRLNDLSGASNIVFLTFACVAEPASRGDDVRRGGA